MVTFEPFDLRKSMQSKGPFDVIFCRNVLIYFDVETRKRILRELRGALFPGGYLVLGGAEATLSTGRTLQAGDGGPRDFLPGSLKTQPGAGPNGPVSCGRQSTSRRRNRVARTEPRPGL